MAPIHSTISSLINEKIRTSFLINNFQTPAQVVNSKLTNSLKMIDVVKEA